MMRRMRRVLPRLLAITLSLTLFAWPLVMGHADMSGMEAHGAHGAHHHDRGPADSPHSKGLHCCDLCLTACSGWTVRTALPSVERLGDNVRFQPALPRRLTPLAWSAGPELPLPLGPPSRSA
ncbi:MAG: hypothetical protein ABI679_04360 [Gemmatimonadota bacterium]